jgi:hypothetical protein
VVRRLLQRLEEGVEGRLREHVHLVNEVDLGGVVAAAVERLLAQAADLVDAPVASGIEFDELECLLLGGV